MKNKDLVDIRTKRSNSPEPGTLQNQWPLWEPHMLHPACPHNLGNYRDEMVTWLFILENKSEKQEKQLIY